MCLLTGATWGRFRPNSPEFVCFCSSRTCAVRHSLLYSKDWIQFLLYSTHWTQFLLYSTLHTFTTIQYTLQLQHSSYCTVHTTCSFHFIVHTEHSSYCTVHNAYSSYCIVHIAHSSYSTVLIAHSSYCTVLAAHSSYCTVHTAYSFYYTIQYSTVQYNTRFSLERPHWADSVLESPCLSVCADFFLSSGSFFLGLLFTLRSNDQLQASHWSSLRRSPQHTPPHPTRTILDLGCTPAPSLWTMSKYKQIFHGMASLREG